MTASETLLVGWLAIALVVVGSILMLEGYRKWRKAMAWSKVMCPEES